MSLRSLLCLILFSFPISLIAQGKNDSLLLKIFLQHKNSDVFSAVDDIKKLKKDNIVAKIKALPANSRMEIIRNADLAASAPWTLLTLSEFNEFKLSGNRVNYENHYFSRRNKLNTLLIGELVANDGRYLKEIVNGIGLICEESTWALPAHMSLQKAGNGLPDIEEPIVDLFVAQTATILSYTKYLLGDALLKYSPLLLPRIDAELKKRVFDPYINRNDFWWMGFQTARRMNNWNIYINSNVLTAALLSESDPELRRLIIEKSMRSVDVFLRVYSADGGCDEGPSYWGMAGGALIEYLDLLSAFSDRKLDFSKAELVHQIGTYIYKVHIDQNYYVNYADAAVANAQDARKVLKFGKLFDDEKLLQFAAYLWKLNNGLERFDLGNIDGFISSLEIRDEFTNLQAKAPQLRYAWLKDLQVLTAREEAGSSKGLFFSAKGGANGESHNHNDVGNFVIYKDGTPIVIDAGVGVYTKQTFSRDRYKLWYMQSDWHNCPTINGMMQQVGAAYTATSVVTQTKGNVTKLTMDLASAYPAEAAVESWKRTFIFQHKEGIVSLKEDYRLRRLDKPSSLNFLVNGSVTLLKNGVLRLTNAQGKAISLVYDPVDFDYEVEIKKIDDARLAGSWHNDLSRIILKKKGTQLRGTHQILFKQ